MSGIPRTQRDPSRRRRWALAAACAAALPAGGAAFGSPWAPCANQPGPFHVWINEFFLNPGALGVEVAAATAAKVRYPWVDVGLVGPDGAILARRTIGTACAANLQAQSGAAALDLFSCINWQVDTQGAVGLVLLNNQGTADAGDDVPLQYISWVADAPNTYGMAACALPQDQEGHILAGEQGVSVQMADATGYDAQQWAVNVYGWNWQGLLPQTLGQVNAGNSQWGDYNQQTVDALLPAWEGDPTPLLQDPPQPTQCQLGPMTAWSQCSSRCSTTAAAQSGFQIQFQPIQMTDPNLDPTTCAAIALRSDVQGCTTAVACTTCQDSAQNNAETDIDCGGGVQNPFPAWWPDADVARAVENPNYEPPTVAATSCARCVAGRQCNQHGDCDLDAGAVCIRNRCTPAWALGATRAVDVIVTANGVDPQALTGDGLVRAQNVVVFIATGNGAVVTAANVTITSVTFVPVNNPGNQQQPGDQQPGEQQPGDQQPGDQQPGDQQPGDQQPGDQQQPGQGQGGARRLVANQRSAKMATTASGTFVQTTPVRMLAAPSAVKAGFAYRRLAGQADQLTMTIRVLTNSQGQAVTIGQNLRARAALMGALLEDSFRPAAPLANNVQVQAVRVIAEATLPIAAATIHLLPFVQPNIVQNPYNNGGDGQPIPSASPSAGSRISTDVQTAGKLSTSAIVGIAIGAAVVVALIAGAALVVMQRMRNAPASDPVRRPGINVGERQRASVAAVAGGVPQQAHEKKGFEPVMAPEIGHEAKGSAQAPAPPARGTVTSP